MELLDCEQLIEALRDVYQNEEIINNILIKTRLKSVNPDQHYQQAQ